MVVSSVAAFAPPSGEFAVLYGPVKTFMNRFVDSINSSQAKHNIFASALCPGFTITEFHQQSGTQDRMDKVPAFMKMSAKDVAEAGVNGILNKKSVVIPGVIYKLIVILFKFTPLWLVRFLGNKLAGGRFKTWDFGSIFLFFYVFNGCMAEDVSQRLPRNYGIANDTVWARTAPYGPG